MLGIPAARHDQTLTWRRAGRGHYRWHRKRHQELANMKKAIVAGSIALMLSGASLAFAQQAPREARESRGMMRPSAEDVSAFTDARIAGLKAGLKLTAEQEKNWPAVETAIRDLAKARADRSLAMADRMSERMAARREARRNGG